MKRRLFVFAVLLASMSALHGCDLLNTEPRDTVVRALFEGEKRIVESDNRFGLKLFRAVNEADAGENVFISPLSISMALGMTLNGANADTRAAMQTALEKEGLSDEEINASYRSLIDLLDGLDRRVVFEIANSIWVREGFEVQPDFLDVNRTYFDAVVEELNFSSPEAVRTINDWVDEKTHGKIPQIIDGIRGEDLLFLINAIYFNGKWTYQFDEDDTRPAPFTNYDGTETEVPMMRLEGDLPYLAGDDFQAVDLPYGDSLYSMTVILPNPGEDVNALVRDLDPDTGAELTDGLRTQEVHLQLPRFKLEYDIELRDALSALGMDVAFDPARADFTRIHPGGGLYISRVKHKAFVEVDEEGTEAAAATAVVISTTSVSGVQMQVDRPFVFVIRERHSGSILFVGKVLFL